MQIIVCIIPFMSVIGVYKAQHDNESYLKPQEFVIMPDGNLRAKEGALWKETFHDLKISKWRFALRLGSSAFFFGLPYGFLAFEGNSFLQNEPFSTEFYLPIFFTLSSILLFFILNARFNSKESSDLSRRLFFAFSIFMTFTVGGTSAHGTHSSGAITLALLILFATILWLYPSELSHRYRISPLLTFGFFVGFSALGTSVYTIYHMVIDTTNVPIYLTAVINIACSLIGFFLLINDKQMKKIALVDNLESEGEHSKPPSRSGAFIMRCKKAADIFLLSQREYEILILLAKGRNASYIQKELFIAEGTAKTHMRNIYRKMNVHNQQALMDFVENLSLD
jgi:DNA-binding CsgD family transcriptional regulator